MKKLVLLAAVALSATMFSCGHAEKEAECADTCATEAPAEVAVVEEGAAIEGVDSITGDTVVVAEVEAAAAPVAE